MLILANIFLFAKKSPNNAKTPKKCKKELVKLLDNPYTIIEQGAKPSKCNKTI